MCLNCLSLLIQRSTRLRFLYLRFEKGISIFDHLPDPVGVIASVGEKARSLGQILQEQFGHRGIMGLTGGEFDLQRQTVFVDPQMHLGGQSSPRTTDTTNSILFFWAAACW